jgi:hypothetical protein
MKRAYSTKTVPFRDSLFLHTRSKISDFGSSVLNYATGCPVNQIFRQNPAADLYVIQPGARHRMFVIPHVRDTALSRFPKNVTLSVW